jgi:cold shock CspA family protein
MTVHMGDVRTLFLDRGYVFLREHATGIDTFAHRDDFNCAHTEIVKGLKVTYELSEYEIKGEKRVKAVNVTPAVKL